MPFVNPFDVVASRSWYLTMPTRIHATPDTIQIGGTPDLLTFSDPLLFHLTDAGDGIVLRTPTNGATTENSNNPRTEFRERNADGKTNASWSSKVGKHSMVVDLMVTALPKKKPVVVIGQIHDAADDVTVFRLEGNTTGDPNVASLWITKANTSHGKLVTNAYRLGTRIQLAFYVENGKTTYGFNGQLVNGYSLAKDFSGAYFKIGNYNQAGDKSVDGTTDYSEVVLYSAQVCHDNVCTGNAPGTITPVDPPVVPPVPPVIDVQPVIDALKAASVACLMAIDKLQVLK